MSEPGWSGRDLEVISRLRRLGDSGHPDAETRERIHGEILGRLEAREAAKPSRRRRILAELLAAAVALVIALCGIGLLLSRNALPGDTLYGIKRAGEHAELGLAFGDSAKGQKHLEFAAHRLDELKALESKDSAAYGTTFADFRREATAGTAELTQLATQGSGDQLEQLRSWSVEQNAKLAGLGPAMPDGVRAEFTSSAGLLDRIEARALLLMARLDCFRITTGVPDELGAVPQPGTCEPPDTVTGPAPAVPVPIPLPAAPTADTPTGRMVVTIEPTMSTTSQPTAWLPPSSGEPAPPAVYPPVVVPASPRAPSTSVPPVPVISIPPLLPGLPGVGIR